MTSIPEKAQGFSHDERGRFWPDSYAVLKQELARVEARLAELEAKQLTPEEAKAAMNWLEKIEPAGVCDCSECRALAKIRARAEEAEGV